MAWGVQGFGPHACIMLLLGKAAKLPTALAFYRDMNTQGIGKHYPPFVLRHFGRCEGVDGSVDCHRRSLDIEERKRTHQMPVPTMFHSCCDCGYMQRHLGRHLRDFRNIYNRCYRLRCFRVRIDFGRLLLLDANARGEIGREATDGHAWPLGLPAVIRFDQVSKSYEKRRWLASSRKVVALEETSLLWEGPGPFALVGDSGAGKSTFLCLLCGDLAPSTGRISIGTSRVRSSSATDSLDERASLGGRTAEGSRAISLGSSSSKKTTGDQPLEAGKYPMLAAKSGGCVVYIDRGSIRSLANAENHTVAQALASAFVCRSLGLGQQNRRSKGWQSMEGDPAKLLLIATGLKNVRDKLCRDLSRGELLCLVLCVGAARALAERATYSGLWRDKMLVAERERDEYQDREVPGPVLCLDEFLETEDARVRRGVEGACARLCSLGVTIVFSTHMMDHVDGMLTSSAILASAEAMHPYDGGGRVATFTRGNVGELRRLKACTYVDWKRAEMASRQARRLM